METMIIRRVENKSLGTLFYEMELDGETVEIDPVIMCILSWRESQEYIFEEAKKESE